MNELGVSADEGKILTKNPGKLFQNQGKKTLNLFCTSLAVTLQTEYQADYGLSLRGLQKDFSVDPLEYGKVILIKYCYIHKKAKRINIDSKVDQALPLDGLITRDEELIEMLKGLNCKKWVFTNAYRLVSK